MNEVTSTLKYPLPNIEDIIHSLGGKCRYFTKLDLAKGFWQIPVSKRAKKYLAFVTRKGTWTFKKMPFGHKNAPGLFQHCMNRLLGDLLYEKCFVYIDDLIIFGETEAECIANAKEVIARIFDDGLKLGGLKCEFLVQDVEVLGHIIKDG